MAKVLSQNDRLLTKKARKLEKGIGPSQEAVPTLSKNKPGKSLGIGYLNNGFSPNINTGKHTFKR